MDNAGVCSVAAYEDQFSRRVARPLPAIQAERLLSDPALRQSCEHAGVDLGQMVAALRLPAAQRLEAVDSATQEMRLFRFIDLLAARGIRYVLIGGLAGRIYGSSCVTGDFDICHARDAANLAALAALLADINAEFRRLPRYVPPALHAATFATETDFVFCTPLGKFDLIGEFTGVGCYASAIEDAITIDVIGHPIRVLSLPKLISAKRSTGRPKDRVVADELTAIARAVASLPVEATC